MAKRIAILGPDGSPVRSRSAPTWRDLRAKYDAAQTTTENSKHWANADGLSASSANSADVRKKLRERARYEVANNGYARGIVKRLADTVIGTGPRLQIQAIDSDLSAQIERDFGRWCRAIGFAAKLRMMRAARTTDGETFALLRDNPKVPASVTLDVVPLEADQIATPTMWVTSPGYVDGIEFDQWGNPSVYHVLRSHPGDSLSWTGSEYDRVPADTVIHWFTCERAGQRRGVPEITAALPLFAQLRRYTLATLSSAEIAALFAALLKSTIPPEDSTESLVPFDTQAVERGMMTALPDGYDVTQLKAEQPTTTYPDFKREIVNEAASGLSVPSNVALGDSSNYNYSSSQLDKQWFQRAVEIDQDFAEQVVVDRVFLAWFDEYRLVAGLTSSDVADVLDATRQWHWDAIPHADPTKEAEAQATRIKSGTTTLADEWAAAGYDWREKADQQAVERAYYKSLKIPYPGDAVQPKPTAQPQTGGDNDAESASGDRETGNANANGSFLHRNGHARP